MTRRHKINLSHHYTGELSHSVPKHKYSQDNSVHPTRKKSPLIHFSYLSLSYLHLISRSRAWGQIPITTQCDQ